MPKTIITAAPTGVLTPPRPVTGHPLHAEETAEEARRSGGGRRIVHPRPARTAARPTTWETYARINAAVRAHCPR